MGKKIGIDAGGTLIKLYYDEKERFHYKKYSLEQIDQLCLWLNMLLKHRKICLTGGKSYLIKEKLSHTVNVVDEFFAMTLGAKYLLKKEGKYPKGNNGFILVSIGTGTSIYYVKQDHYERLYGTGVGGGTFLGMGTIIAGNNNFNELLSLAQKGNREQSDLLVKDLYASETPPLAGELTAANFGKVHRQTRHTSAKIADHMAALMQMIGETILLLANQAAKTYNTKYIVFVGSMLEGNGLLKEIFISFREFLDFQPIFLEKGAYVGAVGAYHS